MFLSMQRASESAVAPLHNQTRDVANIQSRSLHPNHINARSTLSTSHPSTNRALFGRGISVRHREGFSPGIVHVYTSQLRLVMVALTIGRVRAMTAVARVTVANTLDKVHVSARTRTNTS